MSETFLRPPPRQGKTYTPPTFKGWKPSVPPSSMVKTSKTSVKTTSKLFVPPPFRMAKPFSAPPLFVGIKPHSPPPVLQPPPLPIIDHQSLTQWDITTHKYGCWQIPWLWICWYNQNVSFDALSPRGANTWGGGGPGG